HLTGHRACSFPGPGEDLRKTKKPFRLVKTERPRQALCGAFGAGEPFRFFARCLSPGGSGPRRPQAPTARRAFELSVSVPGTAAASGGSKRLGRMIDPNEAGGNGPRSRRKSALTPGPSPGSPRPSPREEIG